MPVTFFKTDLRCSRCGRESTAWIENKLGDLGATYAVGDCPGDDIQLVDFEQTCLTVRAPRPGGVVSALLPWTCALCHLRTWAVVTLQGGCLQSIESADLDRASLERVHFVGDDVDEDFERFVGESMWTDARVRPDWLATLRAALAAGGR